MSLLSIATSNIAIWFIIKIIDNHFCYYNTNTSTMLFFLSVIFNGTAIGTYNNNLNNDNHDACLFETWKTDNPMRFITNRGGRVTIGVNQGSVLGMILLQGDFTYKDFTQWLLIAILPFYISAEIWKGNLAKDFDRLILDRIPYPRVRTDALLYEMINVHEIHPSTIFESLKFSFDNLDDERRSA